ADELTRRRATLAALLGETAATLDGRRTRGWPTAHRIQAKGLRAVLVKLATDAGNTKSRQALADVEDRAAGPLAAADELHRAAADALAAAQAEALAQRTRAQLEQRHAVEVRRQQQREAAQRQRELRQWQDRQRAAQAAADRAHGAARQAVMDKLART